MKPRPVQGRSYVFCCGFAHSKADIKCRSCVSLRAVGEKGQSVRETRVFVPAKRNACLRSTGGTKYTTKKNRNSLLLVRKSVKMRACVASARQCNWEPSGSDNTSQRLRLQRCRSMQQNRTTTHTKGRFVGAMQALSACCPRLLAIAILIKITPSAALVVESLA